MNIEPFGKIKLIIWDLDETFWRGTLSEEGAIWRDENESLVRDLARNGVISSICSHNEESRVFEVLERHKLREFFVFPKVSWDPKGPLIADTIRDAQLRPQNVLFIDDQPRNLAEAREACPGIKTAEPEHIESLFTAMEGAVGDDPELKRLKQYQILEQKHRDRNVMISQGMSRENFLHKSQITIRHFTDVTRFAERIHTIINRTNQLNFTKVRHERIEDTRAMLERPDWRKGCFQVLDRYGDYGIVAFYAGPNDGPLVHFLFSCRVMNMGIVEYVYDFLARPDIQTEDPLTSLKHSSRPAWVQRDREGETQSATETSTAAGPSVLARGGCLLDFLEMPLSTELQATVDLDLSQWGSHSSALRLIEDPGDYTHAELNRFSAYMANTPVFPSTMIFDRTYDLYILEFSKDYRCSLYEADPGIYLPIAPVGLNLRDARHWPTVDRWRAEYRSIRASGPWFSKIYSPEGLAFLRDETRFVPARERRDLFKANMVWLLDRLFESQPQATVVFLLNSASQPHDMLECWQDVPEEVDALNRILTAIAADRASVGTVRLQDYVTGAAAYTSRSPFLLRWDIVRKIALEIGKAYNHRQLESSVH